MSSYNHLTLKDRECILLGVTLKDTYQVIAQRVGCSKATVSREIKRNGGRKAYSAVKAQENYQGRRLKSRRPRLGYNPLKGNKYETQDLLSLGGFLFANLFDTRSAIFSKLLSGFGSFDQGFR